MSTRGIAGTYEIEVLLGSQQVCLLEFDLPETKSELRTVKIDSDLGQEYFRGLLSGIFSLPGEEDFTRQIQVYDLLEGISTLREAMDNNEPADKLRTKLSQTTHDEMARECLQYFFLLAESGNPSKLVQLFSSFSKFILTKKESLPKVTQQSKPVPRWDRVIKNNVHISDEPAPDIEVSSLEEEITEESDISETEWTETTGEIEGAIEGESDEAVDTDIVD